jgi:flagellar basal body P-ring protein FlgI
MPVRWWLPAALVSLASAGGCSSVEKAKPRPEPARAESTGFTLNVPQIMRGTIASECVLDGYRPVVVRGYGLVVGLNGTGSRDIPTEVRAHMLSEMSRMGIGSPRYGMSDVSPEQMLNSLDTAVVVVEGVIPPGAVEGTPFDVRVFADPRTGTMSIEGGRLYTAELRPGPLLTGSRQAGALAKARGPVFINPFAEPGAVGRDAITRNAGLVMQGGVVSTNLPLKLRLTRPSHSRASTIQNSINARFPVEPPTDPRFPTPATARGESDESIEINVPPSYRGRTEEFIELLQHMTIELGRTEAVAANIRRFLQENPGFDRQASWRWQALGAKVLPIIKPLYEYPEQAPRLAALRAGARLNDALVIPHLIQMSAGESNDARRQAIDLLREMPLNPQIDQALRALLDHDDVETRLHAYEVLAARRDPFMRRQVVDGKFAVDLVESPHPMIYITQGGEPRIAVFGRNLALERPLTVLAWSNRLMLRADHGDEEIELYYREPGAAQGSINRVSPRIEQIAAFLGHRTTIESPSPGLDLSYAETVGALHQIWRQGYLKADFKAEQDRILAAILDRERTMDVVERPEFAEPDTGTNLPPPGGAPNAPGGAGTSQRESIPGQGAAADAAAPRGVPPSP